MNSNKKIVIIINSLTPGGAENQVVNMLNLLQNNFEFHVITLLKNDDNFIKKNIDLNKVFIHALNSPQKPYFFPIVFLSVLKLAKKIKPDLVHGILFYGNILSRGVNFVIGCKTVNSIYDISEEPAFKLRLLKMSNNRTHKIFIDNKSGKENYVVKKIARAEQMIYTPNGIEFTGNLTSNDEIRAAIYRKIGFNKKDRLWLNVSRFATQKDHVTLIKTFALLVTIDPINKLILVGDGDLVEEIKTMIITYRLEKNVFYLGRINDIYTLCKTCNIYVCSSAWEGMPIIIMQAMLFKLPVVSTAVGAIPDLIEDKITGYLCERRNPESLLDAMTKMIATTTVKKEEIKELAFKKIKEEFSLERLKENWLKNYNDILNDNP